MDIQGKVVIVTGGASGLGEGTARYLAEKKARVVIADMQEEKGEAVAKSIGAQFVACNTTDELGAKEVVRKASELGALVGLVNCAGVITGEKLVSSKGVHSLENFNRIIQINLVGTFNMIRLCAEKMAENEPELSTQERGVIISTASIAAYEGQIGQAAYSASKAGVVGMTLPIARELAKSGIRNMTIAPGLFSTPMILSMPQSVQDALGASIPFPPRLGSPQDFAQLVAHIFDNAMLNGEVIRLDGALRLLPK